MKKIVLAVAAALLGSSAWANIDTQLMDVWLPGGSNAQKLLENKPAQQQSAPYTLISYTDYHNTVSEAQADVMRMLVQMKQPSSDDKITQLFKIAGNYLQYVPYGGGEGEGDWCDAGLDKTGCMHIQQDPVYRTDTLNCTTFVQLVLAMIGANNLQDFNKNIVNIAYGAQNNAGLPTPQVIAYSNRNNFADGDFNAVNQHSGLLKDVTGEGVFSHYVQSINANITRANWFAFQEKPSAIANNVRVFTPVTGVQMAAKFADSYGNFYQPENVATDYIPKQDLVIASVGPGGQIQYAPNEDLINQIPTPSVVEVIRDDSKWFIGGVNIVDLIGSGTSVSHMALLYRQHFNQGQVIYQKTYCYLNNLQQKVCAVTPVSCNQQNGCTKTMMLAATSAYPNGYVWTQNLQSGAYSCVDPKLVPSGDKVLSSCNRVVNMPFGDYITFQYNGAYIYLAEPSIVGFNIQQAQAKPQ